MWESSLGVALASFNWPCLERTQAVAKRCGNNQRAPKAPNRAYLYSTRLRLCIRQTAPPSVQGTLVPELTSGVRDVPHGCSKKNRSISRPASGPYGSVYDPAGLPPDHAWPAPWTIHDSSTT